MKFLAAYRSDESDAQRYVFQIDKDTFLVVKSFGEKSPRTVKIWDLENGSLKTTVSKWSTNIEFQPAGAEVADAEMVARQLIKRASA